MSFDVKQRLRELHTIARLSTKWIHSDVAGFLTPKIMFGQNQQTYYVYIQPIILLFQLVWLIVLIYTLKTPDFMKKYGFMTIYSFIDIFWISAQNLVLLYTFTDDDMHLRYEMCFVFEVFTCIIPRVLIPFSQWLKVAQAFQKCLIIYKPMTYGEIFTKIRIGIFMTIILTISICIGVLDVLSIDIVKVKGIDRLTMRPTELCTYRRLTKPGTNIFDRNNFYMKITFVIVASLLPSVLMLILSLATVCLIWKQKKRRRALNASRTTAQAGLERLVKVTVAASVVFAVITLPIVFYVLPVTDTTLEVIIGEHFGILYAVLYLCSIPVNTIMFSWLSTPFRTKFRQLSDLLRWQTARLRPQRVLSTTTELGKP